MGVLQMASNVGSNGFIYAYEPGSTFLYLEANCKINDFTKITHLSRSIISDQLGAGNMVSLSAVPSSHSEVVSLQLGVDTNVNVPCNFNKFNYLYTVSGQEKSNIGLFVYDMILYSISCPLGLIYNDQQLNVTTIDNELRDVKKIDFIRFDVEGYECKVLKGSYQIIKNNSDILLSFEWQPSLIKSQEGHNDNTLLKN